MKAKRIAIPIVLAVLAGLGGAWWKYGRGGRADGTEIVVSGNIEVTDAEVAFKLPGRIEKRYVDEGEPVREGQVIAELETADLKAELDLRTAECAAAEAAWNELKNGSRREEKVAADAAMGKAKANRDQFVAGLRPQEKKVAETTVERTAAELDRASKELKRAGDLLPSQAISKELFDQVQASYNVAKARHTEALAQNALAKEGYREEQVRQAEEGLREASAQRALVMEGPRREKIEQAEAKFRAAEAALALARTRLGYATVRSPLTGVVLTKNAEPGEYVSPGTPVVTVADLKNVWLRAYLDGPDQRRVKLGQKALVTIDGRPEPYEGRIGFIAAEAEFTPKSVQTPKERTKLVYRVKIYVDNAGMELKRGMPADARIQLDSPYVPAEPPAKSPTPATPKPGPAKPAAKRSPGE